ncbi:MAG TPA: ribosome maturation factor RimM [Usitatibacter sp.]|nr:ribosome maturation factor RimM [Usitatibacter sp.]
MGRIAGAFGIQGWVKVRTFTEAASTLGEHGEWIVRTREGWRPMALDGFEVHSKGPVAKLAGCEGRDGADALRGAEVAVTREALGEAGEGSLFWVDLVGLEVVSVEGVRLGKVEELFEAGDTSVMVLKDADAKEVMIPFVPDYVKAVDREAKRITVDWKEGYAT